MADATSAYGTLLQIGNGGGPETFTTIAEVKNITGPSLALDTADVTHHASTGGWRERIATLLDGGEVSADLNFLPTNATQRDAAGGLLNDMKNGTLRNFQVVWSDGSSTTWSFAAFVTAFEPSAGVEDPLEASVTLTISGQPTLA